MPLATPVCERGTASTTRLDMAANASPNADPPTTVATSTCQTSSCTTARPSCETADRAAPITSRRLEPYRAASRPDSSPARNVASDWGSSSRPDTVTEAPKPYPARSGVCRNCGQEGVAGVHADAEQQRHQVGGPDRRDPHHPHVDQRRVAADLGAHPQGAQQGRRHEQADGERRAPAPVAALADRQQEADQPGRQQQRPPAGRSGPPCAPARQARTARRPLAATVVRTIGSQNSQW